MRDLVLRVRSASAVCVASMLLAGCGAEPSPPPVVPTAPTSPSPAPAPPSPHPAGPELAILLRPIHEPSPVVHVEVKLVVADASFPLWRILRSPADRIANAVARDDKGDLAVSVEAKGPSVELTMARPTSGPVHLQYDVRANSEAPDDPLGQLVLEDRFRGAGEGLIALPETIDDAPIPTLLRIDGDALRAPNAASSLGWGATRRAQIRPRALRYSSFLSGSMGGAIFEDQSAGRDEAGWLGYTAFDPRPAMAELAVVRSALGEQFKTHEDAPQNYLLIAQTRPIGSFSTTGRAGSVLVQVGPSEPWSASLQLAVVQQLVHRWIGGELRMAAAAGREAEAWWFNDGVARYVAMHTLSRLGMVTPADVRSEIAGQLSVLATTPYGKHTNVELAELAAAHDVARAVLVARGALYAAREAAVINARSKGERSLDLVLRALVAHAAESGQHALTPAAWVDALAKDDPDAQHAFDEAIGQGVGIELPATALGPCFHPASGDYVAFDPGFDVVATSESRDGRVVGLRADGPAAKGGLREGDLVESMIEREGDPEVPVKIAVSRAGSKVSVTYVPKGPHGRGQTWTRVRTVADDRCGEMP